MRLLLSKSMHPRVRIQPPANVTKQPVVTLKLVLMRLTYEEVAFISGIVTRGGGPNEIDMMDFGIIGHKHILWIASLATLPRPIAPPEVKMFLSLSFHCCIQARQEG